MVLCPNSDGIVRVGEIACSVRWQTIGYDHTQCTGNLLAYELLFVMETPPKSPSRCEAAVGVTTAAVSQSRREILIWCLPVTAVRPALSEMTLPRANAE